AHRHQVVHRDIKPDNVLLSEGHALVTDFGVAKAVAESTGKNVLTSLGVALGTPAYMAPEQATADPHTDHRADIYAVGAMAYEMLSGRPPFNAMSAQAMLAAHVTETPDPVTKHRSTVPEALNAVVLRCLAKKPADRYQRADELVPEIEAILTPTGGTTPTATQPHQAVGGGQNRTDGGGQDGRGDGQASSARVAGLFAAASVGVLGVVYAVVQLAGLPDWVFYGAIVLLAIGLPIMLLTSHHERRRAAARSSGRMQATPSGGLTPYFTWRKALMGGGVAFAGLGVLSTAYMTMRAMGIGPAGSLIGSGALGKAEWLVVADFDNATPDTALGRTVTDLLRIAMAQSRVIRVLEREQVGEVLERMRGDRTMRVTPAVAGEVAAREGLKAYVTGEIRSVGSGYALSARLLATGSNQPLVTLSEEVMGDDGLMRGVGALSAKLRERIGESLRSVRADPPLERFTTTSIEALRLYSQAIEVANGNDYRRAVALLKEAVSRDSTFAMAWRRMGGHMISVLGVEMADEGVAALRRAYALRERLSERERYYVEASYWGLAELDMERAVTAWLALLQKYPEDPVALNALGNRLGNLGRFAERDQYWRRAIATGHAEIFPYNNLFGSLRARGLHAVIDTVLEQFERRFSNHSTSVFVRAGLAGDRMNWDEVVRIADQGAAQHPTLDEWALDVKADVAQLRGQLREADRLRERSVRLNAPRFEVAPEDRDFRIQLDRVGRQVWFAEDRTRFAAQVENLWQRNKRFTASLAPLNRRYPQFINLFTRVGRPDRARQLQEEYDALLNQRTRDLPGQRAGFRRRNAMITAAQGQPLEAIELLRAVRADNPGCRFCDLNLLGDAYDQAGDGDSAVAHFERYLDTPGNRMSTDAAWLAGTYRRLGELHETRGNWEKAVEYYGRFVELWKNADPELQPLVAQARERMARLVGEGR
ncbi:MAG TPA: protein kinase, partial [Gemmatimonadales bacterium]